ncbi:MAG: type II toxin-antitoxin system death-on-curing family toxin, partial [Chloroflexota bacterium]
SEMLYINGQVLQDDKILRGEQQIREIERLDAAVARPAASAFGADAYPTLSEKAAVLFHSVTRNHPFRDGNKRTATLALLFMLYVNGQRVHWDAEEALEWVLDVAEGRKDAPELADWLPLEPGERMLEADADHDTAIIDNLMIEHRWLLDELAER